MCTNSQTRYTRTKFPAGMIDVRAYQKNAGIKYIPSTSSSPFSYIRSSLSNRSGRKANELHRRSDLYDIEYNVSAACPLATKEWDHSKMPSWRVFGICPWPGSSPGTRKTAEATRSAVKGARESTTHTFNHPPSGFPHSEHFASPLLINRWNDDGSCSDERGKEKLELYSHRVKAPREFPRCPPPPSNPLRICSSM